MKNERQQGVWIIEDANEFFKLMEDMQQAYLEQKGVGRNDQ